MNWVRVFGNRSFSQCVIRLGLGSAVGLMIWLLLSQTGCGKPPHVGTLIREPSQVTADSLLFEITGADLPVSLDGRGSLRLQTAEKELPSLTLRFSLRDTTELRTSGKPGMFAPVFSAWAGAGGWNLRLPRMRAVLESFDDSYNRGTTNSVLTGKAVVRFGWYMLAPQALVSELSDRAVFSMGESWVITGQAEQLGASFAAAEVVVRKDNLGIESWRLKRSSGETLIEITYRPALVKEKMGDRPAGLIQFVAESLHLKGGVLVKRLKGKEFDEFARPEVPAGWEYLPGSRLGDLLEAAYAE